jgi:L-ascorbate metabolism protein UlaG (beta-lactamase superfamily)
VAGGANCIADACVAPCAVPSDLIRSDNSTPRARHGQAVSHRAQMQKGVIVRRQFWVSSALLVSILATLGGAALLARIGPPSIPTAAPAQQNSGITVEYRGWSHYKLTSPSGKIVLTNPFVNNPDAALNLEETIAQGADIIVVADGHGDEQGQTIEIAQATGARVVTPAFEMGTWFAEMGIPRPQLSFTSPGETFRYEGITVRVLGAIHGSSPPRPSESVYYPGVAATFMITFENGYTVYFSGSSAATMDMMAWGDWYKPDAVIAHQNDRHEPRDAAAVVKYMTNSNPNLKTVFPHHHRRDPVPGGLFRPSDLRAAMQEAGVTVTFIDPTPLQPYVLTK